MLSGKRKKRPYTVNDFIGIKTKSKSVGTKFYHKSVTKIQFSEVTNACLDLKYFIVE